MHALGRQNNAVFPLVMEFAGNPVINLLVVSLSQKRSHAVAAVQSEKSAREFDSANGNVTSAQIVADGAFFPPGLAPKPDTGHKGDSPFSNGHGKTLSTTSAGATDYPLLCTGLQSVVKGPPFPLMGSDGGKAKCRIRSLAASVGASRQISQC